MSWDIAAEIPGAECQIVPQLKHLGLLEVPEAFTLPVLDFLQQGLNAAAGVHFTACAAKS
jgi:hypothetical protein